MPLWKAAAQDMEYGRETRGRSREEAAFFSERDSGVSKEDVDVQRVFSRRASWNRWRQCVMAGVVFISMDKSDGEPFSIIDANNPESLPRTNNEW